MLFNFRMRNGIARQCRRLGSSLFLALAFMTAYGQLTYRDHHDFGGTVTNANGSSGQDGTYPEASVSFDASGNAYGATTYGGPNNGGMIWEITSSGKYKDLHDFGGTVTNADGSSGPDGTTPFSSISFDSMGNLYGTASAGGANKSDGGEGSYSGDGMLWEITAAGVYKDLHDFGGTITFSNGSSGIDGFTPYAAVTFSNSGNLYGTAYYGGAHFSGLVWEFTSGGVYKDLYDFGGTVTNANGSSGPNGEGPAGGVVFDSQGDMFGTTTYGGPNGSGSGGFGMVWEISASGGYKDLHDFGGTVVNANGTSGNDGRNPYSGVTLNSAGDKFGSTTYGGPNNNNTYGDGLVWEITSDGTYIDLHDFGGTIFNADGFSGEDGDEPYGNVAFDALGDMFGTTEGGGGSGIFGMVWEITSGGTYKDLHDFGGSITYADGTSGSDGDYSYCGVTVDSAGDLYGATYQGSHYQFGMVWELAQPPALGLTLSPSTIGGLGTSTATVTLANPAPTGGTLVNVHPGAGGYLNMPATVTVPAGATTATFTITGTSQRPSTVNMGVFASDTTNSAETILTIQGDSLKSFSLSPSQIKWTSGTSTATLSIASAAPPGGWNVTLTPGVSGYVNMPASVTIPAGSTSTTFSITGNALRFFTLDLGITASDGGSKATATLVIAGDAVKSLSLSPSTIGWGGTSTATVTLVAPAPPGGWLVNVNPGASGYVTMPASVTVPAGATSTTLTIMAGSQRSSNLTMGIYANDGPSNQSATLTIQGDSVKSLTLNPSTITALGTSTATITLASAAPPGGWVLTMHPGASGFVSMPSTLIVPAGATTATFAITGIAQHSSTIDLGIFVSDGNSSQEAILTIT